MSITIRIVQTGSSFYFVLISQEEILPGLVNRFRDLCKQKFIKSQSIEKKLLIFSAEGKENEVQQVLQSLDQSEVAYKRLKRSWKKDSKVKYLIELHPAPNQLSTLQQDIDTLKSQSPNLIFEFFPFIKIIEISSSIPQTILELLKILIEDSGFKNKCSFIIEDNELAAAYKNPRNIKAPSILMNQFEFDGYVKTEAPHEHLQISPIKLVPETTSLTMFQTAVFEALQDYENWYKDKREPGEKPYREKENGFFSKWRHTDKGQQKAKILYAEITSKEIVDIAQIKEKINGFLSQYKDGEKIHVHSFASFLLDKLNQFHDSPWQHLYPSIDTNKYTYMRYP